MATKKWREGVLKELNAHSFGAATFDQMAKAWATIFERYFGARFLSARQLVTVPAYTLVVSCVYVGAWLIYNIHGDVVALTKPFSPIMRQALHDFFHEAIFVALVVDFCSISLTRIAIRAGRTKGFLSFRFILFFILAVGAAFFIFTLGLFFLRVADMVRLYMDLAPQDPIPVMPYRPLDGFEVLLNLFNTPSMIHSTSRGVFSTYFIPEPVLFYTAVTGQLSLLFIVASNILARFAAVARQTSVKMLQTAGTPAGAAAGVFASMLLWMLTIVLVFGIVAFHRS